MRAGYLYNVTISALILGIALLAFWRAGRQKEFAAYFYFVLLVGLRWGLDGLGNLAAWFDPAALRDGAIMIWPIQLSAAAACVTAGYYLFATLLTGKTAVRRITLLHGAAAAFYLFLAWGTKVGVASSYWGAQWADAPGAKLVYLVGLLLPLAGGALIALAGKGRTPALGILLFTALELLQTGTLAVSWQALLYRLGYLLIPLGAVLYFPLVAPAGGAEATERPRFPFWLKLFLLFLLLALVPVIVSSLLLFFSFNEVIGAVVDPALAAGLGEVRMQTLFLIALTGILVVFAATLAARAIADPLREISNAIGRISRGDFTFRLRHAGNDEVGDVVKYFNEMAAQLGRSTAIRQDWSQELEAKVRERTAELKILFEVARAAGSSLDLELLISRTMDILGVQHYALVSPDGQVRCQRGSEADRQNALRLPLKVKGADAGTLVLAAGRELAEKKALLSAVVEQLAVAIENVGVYEKEKAAVGRLTELDRLKDEFISMVSHELRTPVIPIKGYVPLLNGGLLGPVTDKQKEAVAAIGNNAERLLSLLDSLFDFAKFESGRAQVKRELFSLHDTIKAAAADAPGDIKLQLALQARNPGVMGDREKIASLFRLLLDNAYKFRRDGEQLKISITTTDQDKFILVAVRDNGIGLAKENLEKIFNKFYQVENTYTRKVGGVGLGLALAKEIVGHHDGKIWAESEGEGKGSTFFFTLPAAEQR
ncbi:MAG: ATP-binding protein [Candidatus Margulisbacteria bacterium]|nr:ATP-binding protein [Candidatus Margulisiibacteriota bacterium]